MARNGADVLIKKNSKLEAFLTRNLSADTFSKIRAHEACIVCSEKEDKAFKFVILSDEWIYLTENPPKKVQETVHYEHVTGIELCNKYPDFLSGEERKNAQHIIIRYRTQEQFGGRRKSTGSYPGSVPNSPRQLTPPATSRAGYGGNGQGLETASLGGTEKKLSLTPRPTSSLGIRDDAAFEDEGVVLQHSKSDTALVENSPNTTKRKKKKVPTATLR